MAVRIEEHEDAEVMIDRVLASVGMTFGEAPMLGVPYEVATVELRPLAEGSLTYAPVDRWQCLMGEEEPSVAVDIAQEGEEYFVVSVNRGMLATRLNDAVRMAEEEIEEAELLLSVIEIPDLHLAAARLVNTDSGAETFIPVLPLPGNDELRPMSFYDGESLVAALRQDAARALDMGMGMGA